MAIEITIEPAEFQKLPAEDCVLCGESTRFWNEETNKPICTECSEKSSLDELKKHKYDFEK